jgi:hypothetical protein
MYCDGCGAHLAENQNFCRACGKPLAGIPAVPQAGRMATHVRLLGILWLAISAFRLLPSLFLLGVGHRRFVFPQAPHFILPLIGVAGGLLMVTAILGFITGWGLLERQAWARTTAIVLGCVTLLDPPFGTALGIYTLWVLLSHDAGEYQRLSRAI